jgi:hypothetical protein
VFKHLWNSDISDKTRETIWKYLQLILFTVMNSVDNKNCLGDTAKLFEAINEDELKTKLDETLKDIQKIFEKPMYDSTTSSDTPPQDGNESESQPKNTTPSNIPDVEKLHGHLHEMMNGKLGKLAMEMAEDASADFNIDPSSINDTGDVFKQLFKNPGKLMNMVKNVGDKLNTKIQSGEISESELMKEGMDILNKMKDTGGGMSGMSELFSKMGMGDMLGKMGGMGGMEEMLGKMGGGKNGKVNVNAMESQLKQNMKNAKMKEDMKKRILLKQQKKQQEQWKPLVQVSAPPPPKFSDEQLIKIFEKPERSARRKPLRKQQSHDSQDAITITENVSANSSSSS